jgi:hypothetical protein
MSVLHIYEMLMLPGQLEACNDQFSLDCLIHVSRSLELISQ